MIVSENEMQLIKFDYVSYDNENIVKVETGFPN